MSGVGAGTCAGTGTGTALSSMGPGAEPDGAADREEPGPVPPLFSNLAALERGQGLRRILHWQSHGSRGPELVGDSPVQSRRTPLPRGLKLERLLVPSQPRVSR